MKKLVFLFIITLMMGAVPLSGALAQDHKGKKHWKQHKKYEKKRSEYYRESAKKRDEYFRERDKKRREYAKEQAKRRKEYYKDRDDWYDDRYEDDWYDDDGYARYHKGGPPPWAPAHGYRAKHHVYFQDYYTFYDPYRDGYVYWQEDDWVFSRSVPTFMANVDLGRARVQLMADVPLSKHPEYYFDRYAERYPRNPRVHINVDIFSPLGW